MTYYPDLTFYTYKCLKKGYSALNVGWLDIEHAYPVGDVSNTFLDRLWAFCREPVFKSRGFNGCEFCHIPGRPIEEQRVNERLRLGSAEVHVMGRDGQVYAAPDLIYHYVVAHHYCPPEEFIQGVMETPLPGTSEYEVLKKEQGLDIERIPLSGKPRNQVVAG